MLVSKSVATVEMCGLFRPTLIRGYFVLSVNFQLDLYGKCSRFAFVLYLCKLYLTILQINK